MSLTSVTPGQSVICSWSPVGAMTVQQVNGFMAICSYRVNGVLQTVQFPLADLDLAPQAIPSNGLSPGAITIPLAAQSANTALALATLWPRQCVVAGAGVVPYMFSPGPAALGNAYIEIVANGLSAAPTVSGMTELDGSSYINTAGCINGLYVSCDGFDVFYSWNSGFIIPSPVGFIAALAGTALTVTMGGLTLGPVTPPLSAFSLVATRSGQPAPYFLSSVNPVSSGDTHVVLNIAGGTFQAGDVVQLSYAPPSSNPLQDPTKQNKVALWLNAAVTVQ